MEKNARNKTDINFIQLLSHEQKETVKSLLLKLGKHSSESTEPITDTRFYYLAEKALGKDKLEKFNQSAHSLATGHIFDLIAHDFEELTTKSIPTERRKTIEDIKTTLARKNTTKILLASPAPFHEMGDLTIGVDDTPPKYSDLTKVISQNEKKNLLNAVPSVIT